jgi:hypothetical protein
MNVVGVVILVSPPRDPIQSKRHKGRRLRAMHMYSAATTAPPWSSKVRWNGRWDLQHDGVVLMVESICGQDFAYAHEVEEERLKKLVKLDKRLQETGSRRPESSNHCDPGYGLPFISACKTKHCKAAFRSIWYRSIQRWRRDAALAPRHLRPSHTWPATIDTRRRRAGRLVAASGPAH